MLHCVHFHNGKGVAIGIFQQKEKMCTKNNKQPPNYTKTKLNNEIHPDGRDCSENVILPCFQTNKWLLIGVRFAYTNRKAEKWNKIECEISIMQKLELHKKF